VANKANNVNLRILIDYDNLNEDKKRKGLLDLTTRALMSKPLPTRKTGGRCEARIYGGWYEATALTQLAQQIITEVVRDFPAILPFRNMEGVSGKLSVSAELARSLEAEPAHHLFNTFRQKSPPRSLKCVHPSTRGCSEPDCPLRTLPRLFETEQCPKDGCSIQLQDLLFRREQKLVDTMLACDMIHAARLKCDYIILVSSDDDLLPAIRVALLDGTPFARFHPKNYYQTASFPAGGAAFIEGPL
jgi:uncharacterized LabA/DUF88 family protein